MCRSHPTALLAALAALSLGGCILMPAPNIHHGTQVTPTGIATVPRLPPFRVSDEATQDQLLLALAQGEAVGRAVDFLTNEAADHGADSMAGEYQIAYAISVPEGAYVPSASGLRLRSGLPGRSPSVASRYASGRCSATCSRTP